MADERTPEPGPGCDYCKDSVTAGTMLSHGGGPFAVVISCPRCGSGEKLAPTVIPNVVVANETPVA